jgi:hypothetical protein
MLTGVYTLGTQAVQMDCSLDSLALEERKGTMHLNVSKHVLTLDNKPKEQKLLLHHCGSRISHEKIQFIPRSKHTPCYKNRSVKAACSKIHIKHMNTLCGKNIEMFNVQPGRVSSNLSWVLSVKKALHFDCQCALFM